MNKKVLLFTTIGKLNDETSRFVTAAFSSWKKWGFDVVVFGEDFHKDLCDQYGFTLNLNYEKSEFGIPIVRSLFLEAQKYEGYDLYSFINSDIIFHKNLFPIINSINIKDFMRTVFPKQTLNERKIFLTSLINLFDGLLFFQSNNIIHRDIKLLNIVYNVNNGKTKYIDFGSDFMMR